MNSEVQFYKEENFRVVEADGFKLEVPEEWEVVRLGDVADYINGYAFSPEDWKDRGLPIIRIQNLNDPEAEFNYFDGEIDSKYIVENGDLLFSWSASIGVYIWKRGRAVLNQHIFKVVPKNNVIKLYLYYTLFLAIEQLKNKVHGSTMKHFKRSELKTTFIPLPPLPEQQKIAHVLMSIDKAIEAVDEAIKQAERIKKGLMQELLTKGIRHEKFKDTEIGRIPEEWEVAKLEDVCVKITDGSHWSPKEVEKSDYKIATVANLKERYIDIDSCKPISKDDFKKLLREGDVPEKGDILFSKDGTVGICFSFNQDEFNIALLSSIAIIKPKKQILDSDFVAYALKTPKIFWQIAGKKTGTALTRIVLKELKTTKIPLPPLPEQQKIAEILSKWDEVIEVKRAKKERLERMKKNVMELLLTGKVRVK